MFRHPHESVERAAGATAVSVRFCREGAIVSGSPAYADAAAPVAQWIERRFPKPQVAGSIPAGGADGQVSKSDAQLVRVESRTVEPPLSNNDADVPCRPIDRPNGRTDLRATRVRVAADVPTSFGILGLLASQFLLPVEDADYLYSILAVSGHLYIGTWLNSAPARIVKVRTTGGGAGTGGLERIGATTLLTDERAIGWAVVTGSSFAYYGTTTQPGRVAKVHLNAGSDTLPERVDGLVLASGENWLGSAVRIGQYLYFGTGTYPGRIVRCVDPAL